LGLFIILSSINVKGQRNFFVGLEPSVTIEKYYDKGEFDLNVFPAVFRVAVTKRIDFRAVTIFNYHFGTIDKGISNIGTSVALPIMIKRKN